MPRTSLSSQFTPEQRKDWHPKIIARNTFKFEREGETVVRLHQTDIVTKHGDGSVTLNSGGWKTVTTKERMAYQMPQGYSLISDRGQWYIVQVTQGYAWDKNNPRVAFFDGIRVPQCFNGSALKKAQAVEKKDAKLRVQIKKFVAKLDKLQSLPEPSQGDCWLCALHDDKGKSWGEHGDDGAHLLEHVREGYLHGSLILNALKWAGYRDPSFIWHMANHDMAGARGRHSLHHTVKRQLKRYLYRKLGLVS